MKRSLILNILILLLMFSFCGCVDDNNGSDSDWGEEGDLEITISANKNAIKINRTSYSQKFTFPLKYYYCFSV